MRTTSASLSRNIAPGSLSLAVIAAALALLCARAHAADFDEITVSAPTVKNLDPGTLNGDPVDEDIVKARVQYDPATLTTPSGVAVLKASVEEAAHKACQSDDPTFDGRGCFDRAVESAQAQVDAALARAKHNSPKN